MRIVTASGFISPADGRVVNITDIIDEDLGNEHNNNFLEYNHVCSFLSNYEIPLRLLSIGILILVLLTTMKSLSVECKINQ